MLVAFEGIDGAGKTTQIDRLTKLLAKRNKFASVIREPGGTPIGEEIRRILLDPINKLGTMTEVGLFFAARAELYKTIDLSKAIVLSDRCWYSTFAYQHSLTWEQVNDLARLFGIPKPDVTFVLQIGITTWENRLLNQPTKRDSFERRNLSYQEEVIRRYFWLDSQDVISVDASKSLDLVTEEIDDQLKLLGI